MPDTRADGHYGYVDCVHRLIEAQVARTPHATAVIDRGAELTYRELDERANQLAHALQAAGVTTETRAGVCCMRGTDMIVALLGVLKAGAAYVPIDPAYPRARIEFLAGDAKLGVVVTQRAVMGRLVGLATRCICVDELANLPTRTPATAVTADHACYVLYTSGSTGQPNGVVGTHRAIAHRLHWQQQVLPYDAGEIASARTALGFVDSVAEIFAPLASGVPLVVLDDEAQRDATLAIDALATAGATRIVLVPSLLATMLDVMPDLGVRAPSLRYWFVGGEPVPVALVERFARAMPGRRLINLYGATELSGDATYFDFGHMPEGLTSSPIGTPLSGVYARIVDEQLREVAGGEVGEICVSGVCVARGYLDRPALTAARFVPNPFPEGGTLYRTRDLGKRLPAGDLQYLGRIDQLVKLRGMRVELGEVEALAGAVPGVTHAVALVHGDRLVVFYTGDRAISPGELRAHVARRAPAELVPNLAIQLDEFPHNANGKVDRAALRTWPSMPVDAGLSPQTDDEWLVAGVWEEVLERAPIGRAQDFHDLGGSSLAAMRIVAKLREHYAVDLPIAAMFEAPTVAGLTARITGGRPRSRQRLTVAISGHALPATLPLSYYQIPFWWFRALTGDTSVVADVFACSAPVDVERLQAAFSETVAAFDALWMRFPRWRPVQRLAPRRPYRFAVCDYRDRHDGGALQREADANTTQPFDLDRPPHVHARLVRTPGGDRLLVAIPHIAADMAAMEMFRRTLQVRYTGCAESPRVTASLRDLVMWERAGDPRDEDARYWQTLAGGPAWNTLPARLFANTHAAREVRAWSQRLLSGALVDRIAACARRHATSLPMALIGSIYAGLGRIATSDDLTLLVMIEKRDRVELRDLFANLTAVMACRAGTARAPVAEVMTRVARQLVASAEHSDDLMRRPTLWNDFWTAAPRPAASLVHRLGAWLARRWPEAELAPETLAQYVFAMVPISARQRAGRDILIAVNILPEVAQGEPEPTGGFRIARDRELPLMLRPGDLVVGSDPLLARTLQIHVTRDVRGVAINLYGGSITPEGLDEINDAIVHALEELVSGEHAVS